MSSNVAARLWSGPFRRGRAGRIMAILAGGSPMTAATASLQQHRPIEPETVSPSLFAHFVLRTSMRHAESGSRRVRFLEGRSYSVSGRWSRKPESRLAADSALCALRARSS